MVLEQLNTILNGLCFKAIKLIKDKVSARFVSAFHNYFHSLCRYLIGHIDHDGPLTQMGVEVFGTLSLASAGRACGEYT